MNLLWVALGLTGLLLVLFIVQRFRAYGKIFAAPHLKEVVDGLPRMRAAAIEGIANTEPTIDDARALLTSAGLLILYTTRRDAESEKIVHHVSVSLGGGPTPHAIGAYFLIYIVKGLGADPRSVGYEISQTRIFHAEWLFSETEHAAFAVRETPTATSVRALWTEAVELRRELNFANASANANANASASADPPPPKGGPTAGAASLFAVILSAQLLAPQPSRASTACPVVAPKEQYARAEHGNLNALLTLADQTKAQLQTPGLSTACATELVYRYWKVYWKGQRAYDSAHSAMVATDEVTPESKAFDRGLKKVGWHRESSEGGSFIWSDESWLLQKFSPHLPPDFREFFEQRSKQGRLTEDAALQVTWDELRARIVTWEKFLKQYPAFPLSDLLKQDLEMYVGMWLGGTASTMITEEEVLQSDLRKSYERFLRESQDSAYFPLLQTYMQLLAAKKFRPDESTRRFLKKNKVQNYAGVEPPVY